MKKTGFLTIALLVLSVTMAAAAGSSQPASNLYDWIVQYLHEAGKTIPPPLGAVEQAIISIIDVVLSLACLYAGLWVCTGTKGFLYKKYFWFLVSINLAWFIMLLFFRGVWEGLDFLVIKLQPDLKETVWNHFAFAVVITPVFLYVWLIARTFSLRFYGALGTFLVSQGFYFLVIYLFVTFVPGENHGLTLIKNNLGATPVVQSYLVDINNITSKYPLMSLLRVRPFRL